MVTNNNMANVARAGVTWPAGRYILRIWGYIPCWGRFFEIVRPFLLRDTTSKIILEYYDIIFFVYILYKYEDFQQPVGGW